MCDIFTGRNAGITISQGAILWYFVSQGRHVPPIVAKFGTAEENNNPLRHAKFPLGGATMFDGIGKNFEKFSKTDWNVCEHDFDHLGAAYNKSFIRSF